MKNLTKKCQILFISILFSLNSISQTDGTLTFVFTETPKTTTYNKNSDHVLAVWIQTNTGGFVKTKLRYVGPGTDDHIPNWGKNASCTTPTAAATGTCNIVDGTSGATLRSWSTYTVSWDGRKGAALTGTLQPDGVYKVTVEETWNHGTTGTALTSYTFTKGPQTDHQTPAASANLSGLMLDWVPLTTGVNEINPTLSNNTIYPNPSNGKFIVEYENINSIKIFNMIGIEIYDEKFESNMTGSKNVDLSKFPKGIYTIQFSNDNSSINRKIILED